VQPRAQNPCGKYVTAVVGKCVSGRQAAFAPDFPASTGSAFSPELQRYTIQKSHYFLKKQ